jgi:bacterioferritin
MSANASSSELDQEYPFLNDIAEIRRRARQHITEGAVTFNCGAEREVLLRLLNESLASELVCVRRYRRHYFMATGSVADAIKDEFLKHSQEEQQHADRLAERIVQLGGVPNLTPHGMLDRSRFDDAEYGDADTLADMVEEDLIAERITIESYLEIIQYIGEQDATTRGLFESILAIEEEHAEELVSMRQDILRKARGASTANVTPLSSGELQ